MTNMVQIKIANLAVNLGCNILVDTQGEICLLQRFFDDEGKNIVRGAPSPYDYYSQLSWLNKIKNNEARNFIC